MSIFDRINPELLKTGVDVLGKAAKVVEENHADAARAVIGAATEVVEEAKAQNRRINEIGVDTGKVLNVVTRRFVGVDAESIVQTVGLVDKMFGGVYRDPINRIMNPEMTEEQAEAAEQARKADIVSKLGQYIGEEDENWQEPWSVDNVAHVVDTVVSSRDEGMSDPLIRSNIYAAEKRPDATDDELEQVDIARYLYVIEKGNSRFLI